MDENSNEAAPQTDERWRCAGGDRGGVAGWLRSSRLGQAQNHGEHKARWGPKTPWTTGAGNEGTTQRLRSPARSRRAGERPQAALPPPCRPRPGLQARTLREAKNSPQGLFFVRAQPPEGDEETWGGPAFPHERPKAGRGRPSPVGNQQSGKATFAGEREHRPDVLERVRAAVAARERGGVVPEGADGPAVCLDRGAGGQDR